MKSEEIKKERRKKRYRKRVEPGFVSLAEVAKSSPYSQEYLSLLARQGKLKSKKFGRNWYTTSAYLEAYLATQGIKFILPKHLFNSSYKGKINKAFNFLSPMLAQSQPPEEGPIDFSRFLEEQQKPTENKNIQASRPQSEGVPKEEVIPEKIEEIKESEEIQPEKKEEVEPVLPTEETTKPQPLRTMEQDLARFGVIMGVKQVVPKKDIQRERVQQTAKTTELPAKDKISIWQRLFSKKQKAPILIEKSKKAVPTEVQPVIEAKPKIAQAQPPVIVEKKEPAMEVEPIIAETKLKEVQPPLIEPMAKPKEELPPEEKFFEKLSQLIDTKIAARSFLGKLSLINVAANHYFRSTPKAILVSVLAIVLLLLLVGGVTFGNLDKTLLAVNKFLKDAQTLQGSQPGTHANEVLLLDKEGNISIYGHVETKGQLRSWVEQGVAPIVVVSTTTVENLSADYLDNLSSKDFTLAFVTKNGNLTYEDVKLEGNVEVGKTLLAKGAVKLLDSLFVYGSLQALGGIETKGANLNLGSGTIVTTNRNVVTNLNADLLDSMSPSDFTLDFVTSQGNVTHNNLSVGALNVNGFLAAYGYFNLGDERQVGVINTKYWDVSALGHITTDGNLNVHGTADIVGKATFVGIPTGSASSSSVYINPASAAADASLLEASVAGSEKFKVDAEGDVSLVGNLTIGNAVSIAGATNFQGNVVLSSPANLTLNAGNITVNQLSAPTNVSAQAATTSGASLAAGTYYYAVTALNANGETTTSTEISTTVDATTNSIIISWDAVTGASGYRIYGRTENSEDQYWQTTATSLTDTGSAGTAAAIPTGNTTGGNGTFYSGLNVLGTTISRSILPEEAYYYNLGSPTYPWSELYVSTINASTTNINGTTTIGGNIVMSDGQWIGLSDTEGRLIFNNQAQNALVLEDANVGIATSTPSATLAVTGSVMFDGDLTFVDDQTIEGSGTLTIDPTGNLYFQSASNYLDESGNLIVSGRVDTDTLQYSGNITINATSSGATTVLVTNEDGQAVANLQVEGDIQVDGGKITLATGETIDAETPDHIIITSGGTQVLDIISGGVSVTGNATTSDRFYVTANGADITGDVLITGQLHTTSTTTLDSYLVVDGDTLFVDSVNDRVGIGTSTPETALSVVGDILGSGNVTIAGNLMPTGATQDIGSAAVNWTNLYVDRVYANYMESASSSVAGTDAEMFTINADAASDATSTLRFYRGVDMPHALINWDADFDRFNFNFPLYLSGTGEIASAGSLNFIANAASTWKNTAGDLTITSEAGTLFATGTSIDLIAASGNISATSSQDIYLATNNIERMRILSTGNVGIASSTPSDTLAVQGNILGSGNITLYGTATSTLAGPLSQASGDFIIGTAAGNVLLAPYGGNVAIGTADASQKLTVYGGDLAVTTAGTATTTISSGVSTFAGGVISQASSTFAATTIFEQGFVNQASSTYTALQLFDQGFWAASSTFTGDLTVNSDSYPSNSLFIDVSEGRLGIGTTTLAGLLTVGTTTPALVVDPAGNVGIGTASPAAKFHVEGAGLNAYFLNGGASGPGIAIGSGTNLGRISTNVVTTAMTFEINAVEKMRLDTSGNLGIGNEGPTSKLTVNGGDMVVSSTGAATTTISSGSSVFAGGIVSQASSTFAATTIFEQGFVNQASSTYTALQIFDQGFWAASSTFYGDLTVNSDLYPSNSLFIDASEGRVGIGTTTLAGLLTVGTSTPALVVDPQGYVGIGTAGPTNTLQIGANLINSSGYGLTINDTDYGADINVNGANPIGLLIANAGSGTSNAALSILDDNTATSLFWVGWDGNIGIGNNAPSSKLTVNGGDLTVSAAGNGTTTISSGSSVFAGGLVSQASSTFAATAIFEQGFISQASSTYTALQIFDAGFWAASSTFYGDLTVNSDLYPSNSLFIDASEGRVGIGTTTLAGLLTVGTSSPALVVDPAGNVGIGTASPGAKLEVNGNIKVGNSDADYYLSFAGNRAFVGYNSLANALVLQGDLSRAITFNINNTFGSGEVMKITSAGNVGIGNENPSSRLTVNGGDMVISSAGTATTTISSGTSVFAGGLVSQASSTFAATAIFEQGFVNQASSTYTALQIFDSGFWAASSTFTGDLTVNSDSYPSNSLFIDASEGRLGIGTTTLDGLLTVGTTTHALVVDPAGNVLLAQESGYVGIGTSTPSDTFAVQGNIIGSGNITLYGTGTSTIGGGLIVDTDTLYVMADTGNVGIGTTSPGTLLELSRTSVSSPALKITSDGGSWGIINGIAGSTIGSGNFGIYDYDASLYRFLATDVGNVGIGNEGPTSRLTVNGGDVVVSSTGAATTTISSATSTMAGGLIVDTDTLYVIAEAGFVGIGASTDIEAPLHIKVNDVDGVVAANTVLGIEGNTQDIAVNIISNSAYDGAIYFGDEGDKDIGRIVYDHGTDSLRLYTNNATQMTILSTGNVGIGNEAPTSKLTVNGGNIVVSSAGDATTTISSGLSTFAGDITGTYGITSATGTFSGILTANGLISQASSTFAGTAIFEQGFVSQSSSTFVGNLYLADTAANIVLGSNYLSGDGGDEGVFVDSSGNVGIASSTLVAKLGVQGDLTAMGNILISGTVDTGQGATEVYAMNQPVQTTDAPTFSGLTLTYGLTAATTTLSSVLNVTGVSTLTGGLVSGASSTFAGTAIFEQGFVNQASSTYTALQKFDSGFWAASSTFTGDLTVNSDSYPSNSLFIDASEGRLGIGTTTLDGLLTVGTTTHALVVDPAGNILLAQESGYVGIGTSTPSDTFAVQGNILGMGNILISGTVDTGQGATEVYAMNQPVQTTDAPTFSGLTLTYGLTAATTTLSSALSVGTTLNVTGVSTLVGGLISNASSTFGAVTIFESGFVSQASSTFAGLLTADGGITADSGVFTVADATGNVHTGGTLDVDGIITAGSGGVALTIADGHIVETAIEQGTLDSTEIEDIYVFNTSDTMTGSLGIGTTLSVTGVSTFVGGLNSNASSTFGAVTIFEQGFVNQASSTYTALQIFDSGFWAASSTFYGDLTVNSDSYPSNSLFIDASEGRLGIGTTTLSGLLTVGTTTPALVVAPDGNVGIGTASPVYILHVAGSGPYLDLQNTDAAAVGNGEGILFTNQLASGNTHYAASIRAKQQSTTQNTGSLEFVTYNNGIADIKMFIDNIGNVGIGNEGPSSRLTVNGGDVVISSTGAATTTISSGVSTFAGGLISQASSTFAATAIFEQGFVNQASSTYTALQKFDSGFWAASSTFTGDLTVNSDSYPSNTLFIDASEGRLGIGTTTLDGLLTVGTTTHALVVDPAGNVLLAQESGYVGIGTSTPSDTLAVQGNIIGSGNITLYGTASSTFSGPLSQASGDLVIGTAAGNVLLTPYGGNVGIGTTTPTSLLTLNESGDFAFGSFNASTVDTMEGSNLDWSTWNSTYVTTSTETSIVKTGSQALKITASLTPEDVFVAKAYATPENWDDYFEKLGFWIQSSQIATTSATTTQTISIGFYSSANDATNTKQVYISEANKWQYEEWSIDSLSGATSVDRIFFRIDVNDISSTNFYIDQIRLYNTDERSAEMFVDQQGSLVIMGRGAVEIARADGSSNPAGIRVDSATVELNQPLAVNVGGDVGMSSDLSFLNTGLSQITSEGPLRIAAGDPNHAENLTLTTQGTGDVVIDLTTTSQDFVIAAASTSIPLTINSETMATTTPAEGIFRIITDVNSDENTVFVIDAGGQVGIGTTTPDYPLRVWGDVAFGKQMTPAFYFDSGLERTGISTTSPRYNLDVWGSFSVGTSTDTYIPAFYVESGNGGRVAIGTTTMSGLLTVGTSTPALVVDPAGNVGIGTAGPGTALHLSADLPAFRIERTNTTGPGYWDFSISHYGADSYGSLFVQPSVATGDFIIRDSSNNPRLYVDTSTGNVGIGNENPSSRLTVNGGDAVISSTGAATTTISSGTSIFAGGIVSQASSTFAGTTIFESGFVNQASSTYTALQIFDQGFWAASSTFTGDLTVNSDSYPSNSLFIDASEGRLGIGTTTLDGLLTVGTTTHALVVDSAGNVLLVQDSGYVGIGTSTPSDTFAVQGNILGMGNILISGTVDTGQGATEVYAMNQPVQTTDAPTFSGLTLTYGLTAATTTLSSVLNVTGVSTLTGGLVSGASSTFAGTAIFEQGFVNQASSTYTALQKFDSGFWAASSTFTGDLTVNSDSYPSNSLFIDASEGRLGIGTTTLDGLLTVGTTTHALVVDPAGNVLLVQESGYVGIGTSTPGYQITMQSANPILALMDTDAGSEQFGVYVSNILGFGVYNFTDARQDLTIDNSGNFGIGTTTPSALLTLNESGDFAFGSFNASTVDTMEASTLEWLSWDPIYVTTSTETSIVKTDSQALKITASTTPEDVFVAKDYATPENWSGYFEKLGFWIQSSQVATSSATTTQTISVGIYSSVNNATDTKQIYISEANKWQYEEWSFGSVPIATSVDRVFFRIDVNDISPTYFYIDQIRLYNTTERSAEMFVDQQGSLLIMGRGAVEIGRADGSSNPAGIRIDSATVELNQPLAVNVGGDVGMNNNLNFTNTGLSQITSEGPLKIMAGDSNHAENLTLKTGGTGDVIVELSASSSSFMVNHAWDASNTVPFIINSETDSTSTLDSLGVLFQVISDYSGDENVVFSVDAAGSYYYDRTAYTPASDVAENYFVQDETIDSGDLVCLTDTPLTVEKCSQSYQPGLLGVISTRPALLLGDNSGSSRMVALIGRVPTRVSTENGPIQIGDSLTSASSSPGVAMKATGPGYTVGMALEPYDGEGIGKIMAFINLQISGGSLDSTGSLLGNSTSTTTTDGEISESFLSGLLQGVWNAVTGIPRLIVNGILEVKNDVIAQGAFKAVITVAKTVIEGRTIVVDNAASLAENSQLEVAGEDDSNTSFVTYSIVAPRKEIMVSGSGTLLINSEGKAQAQIAFHPSFSAVLSDALPIKVIVSPTSYLNGQLYVAEKTINGFTVKEINSQDEGVSFDWIVTARLTDPDLAQQVLASTTEDIASQSLPTEPVCQNGESRACGSQVGTCLIGLQICEQGVWGECFGGVEPVEEICDGLDNDCDGTIDNNPLCGITQPVTETPTSTTTESTPITEPVPETITTSTESVPEATSTEEIILPEETATSTEAITVPEETATSTEEIINP